MALFGTAAGAVGIAMGKVRLTPPTLTVIGVCDILAVSVSTWRASAAHWLWEVKPPCEVLRLDPVSLCSVHYVSPHLNPLFKGG